MEEGALAWPSLGVVGGGTVGRATARAYDEFTEVRVFDTDPTRRTHHLNEVLECDLIFVCLPTPSSNPADPVSPLDCSVVEGFFTRLSSAECGKSYVLRSTVPLNMTQQLAVTRCIPSLVYSPEFLTARCALLDANLPSRHVIGVPHGPEAALLAHTLASLYRRRFSAVPVFTMSSLAAELVKLGANGFFAVKVAYFNELASLAHYWGVPWQSVREAILADGRLTPNHTQVPGPDGQLGFGGACLPKDLGALVYDLRLANLCSLVTQGAAHRNVKDRALPMERYPQ